MPARFVQIADDVVSVINGGTFTIPDVFTAERLYIPEFKLEDVGSLKVSVIPSSRPEVVYSRDRTQVDFVVSVGIQKATDNLLSDFDDMVEFVEEINDLFKLKKLPTTDASWVASETDPVYDHEYGTEMNVFTSVLSLTFRDHLKV